MLDPIMSKPLLDQRSRCKLRAWLPTALAGTVLQSVVSVSVRPFVSTLAFEPTGF